MEHTPCCVHYKTHGIQSNTTFNADLREIRNVANEYRQNNVNEVEHVQFDIPLTKNKQKSTREGETLYVETVKNYVWSTCLSTQNNMQNECMLPHNQTLRLKF
jgi:hypothetical protein